MKKIIKIFLFLSLCICSICCMGACSFGNSTPSNPHEHSFIFEKVGEKYLKSPADCTHSAVYYCSCSCGEMGTVTFEYGDPLGHSFTNYVYNEDATCGIDGTKTAKCDRCIETDTKTALHTALSHEFKNYIYNNDADCLHDGTKTALCEHCKEATNTIVAVGTALNHSFIHYESNNDATCESDGTKTAKCERCDERKTITDTDSKLGHLYGVVEYEWNGQNCTATRVCQHDNSHKETETVTGVYVKDTDATCTVCEKGHYKAIFVNSAFLEQNTAKNSVDNGNPLEHDFNNYISDNNATCTEDGTKTSKCSHCDAENTITDVGSKGHSYGETTYAWNGQNCTATRVCQKDNSHKETETVVGVYVKDTDATCTVCEKGHYKATFTNSVFIEQNTAKDSVNYGNPLNHNFEWIIDKPASKIETGIKHEKCTRCEETRNNNTVIPVITCDHLSAQKVQGKLATCTENGIKDYWYCGDCQKYFSDSSCQIEITTNIDDWKVIEKTGHNYGTASYVWNGQTCTATRVCQNNIMHTETETVTGIYVKDTDATCTVCEKGHYKATFNNPAFAEQYTAKDSVNYGNPLGHSFTNYVSNNNATCSNDGTKTAQCDRCSETDTITDVGSKTGHTYSTEWTSDENYHWHQAICEHNTEISDKETHKWNNGEVILEPTIYENGKIKKTCTVCGTTKEEYIEKLTSYQVSIYDGENLIETYRIEKDKNLEVEAPQKEGYRFDHWSIECEYDEDKQIYTFKKISCDTEIKAIFVKTYIVEFVDYNGNLLDLKVVDYDAKAETTVIPEREGYRFIGWDKQTIKVIDDMVVKATYIKQYSVTFIYGNNKTKTLMVDINTSFADISQKDIPNEQECFLDGYEFNGWDNEFENIISSQVINAKYSLKKHLVRFYMPDGITQLGESQYIPHGECAEVPIPNEYYYDKDNNKVFSFTKWDKDFSAIEEDNVIIKAIYEDEYNLPAIIIDYITNGDDTTVEISTYAPLIENYPNTRIYSIEFSFDYKTSSDQNNINITNTNVNLNATWLYTVLNNEEKNLYNDEINNKTKLYNFAWSSTGGVAIGNDWFIKILCGKYGSGITINKDTFRLNSFSMYIGDSEGESLQKISPVVIYR